MLNAAQSAVDGGGLICAFQLGASAQSISWEQASTAGSPVTVWMHFNAIDVRARTWIAGCPSIPSTARELLLSNDHHVRMERVGDGIFAALGDLHHDLGATPEALGLLRLYVDDRLIVTIRRHPLKATDRLRRDAMDGVRFPTPLHVLLHLLGRLAEAFGSVISELTDLVDDAEDRLLVGQLHLERRELGRIRRFLARLRRHMIGSRTTDVDSLLPDWCTEQDSAAFRRALEKVDGVAQDLDLVQVRARLLQEEIAAQYGEATNRNIYFLSIITALLLPATLVTGIFGMNVGGLPFTEGSTGFWWTMALIAAAGAGTMILLRWRKLF